MFPKSVSFQVDPGLVVQSVDLRYAADLYTLIARNTKHLQRYLPNVVAINSLEAAREHIQAMQRLAEQGEILELHVLLGSRLCGAIRLNNVEWEHHKLSIAYFLDAECQGKGIITRAARSVIRYCFRELSINRIELRCATGNRASIAVAERLGFTREGELRQAELLDQGYVNHYVYGLLSQDLPLD
jgi:ribosomal-protein-serine acetyltransferase